MRGFRHVSAQGIAISETKGYVGSMLQSLMNLLTGDVEADPAEHEHAGHVAIAAILIEAAMADGIYAAEEQALIGQILAERFGLTEAEAAALRAEGQAAQSAATDLVRFTRAVKDSVPYEDRVGVIEAVWRVVYADGDRDHEESALVRKLSGLLYVPDKDAGLARQRILAER